MMARLNKLQRTLDDALADLEQTRATIQAAQRESRFIVQQLVELRTVPRSQSPQSPRS